MWNTFISELDRVSRTWRKSPPSFQVQIRKPKINKRLRPWILIPYQSCSSSYFWLIKTRDTEIKQTWIKINNDFI